MGVKPFYEVPVVSLESIDYEQTIEGFLFKKAKHNNTLNYGVLRKAFGSDSKITSLEKF